MAHDIYKKMSDVMKDIGYVGKDSKNTAQGFKFRGIDSFMNTLYPSLCKHGVFMTPECVAEQHEIREVTRSNGKAGVDKHVTIQMKYTFYTEDGSHVTVGPIPAEGLDSGDKATNKALSAALKYALMQAFCVPTEDMTDGDFTSPEIEPIKKATGQMIINGVPVPMNPVIVNTPNIPTEVSVGESLEVPKAEKKVTFRRPVKKEEPKNETASGGWE